MKRFNSIKEFLRTLNPEERNEVQWSIDALMVQYWEILREESAEGKDKGGITIPVGDNYLTISLNLEWEKQKLNASVSDIKLLDNYELISTKNDRQWPRENFISF